MRAIRLLNLRRLRLHPVRALITIVAVGAGVALSVSVIVLVSSANHSLRAFGRSLSGPTAVRVVGATSRGGLEDSVLPTVRATRGVDAAIPVVQAVTYIDDGRGATVTVIAFGVDCSIERLIGRVGCDPAAIANAGNATVPFVSQSLAARMGPGAAVRTDLSRRSLRNAVVIPALDRLNHGNVVVYPLPVAQRLFSRVGRLDAIYVQPAPGVSVPALRADLQRAVGAWNGVLTASDPPPGAGVLLAAFVPLFSLVAIFVLGIAAVLIYNTMTLALEDRRRDLAILGALGITGRTMVGGVMLEAASLGLAGGLLGIVGGVALAHPLTGSISSFSRRFVGIPITVNVTSAVVVVGALLGTLLAALSAVIPARRALRMDVAGELSNREMREATAPRRTVRRLVIFGGVALFGLLVSWAAERDGGIAPWQATAGPIGLVIASLGSLLMTGAAAGLLARFLQRALRERPGLSLLGAANLARDPGRTGVMVVAAGGAISVAFVVASIHVSVRDAIASSVLTVGKSELTLFTVSPDNGINLDAKPSPALLARIANVPGVRDVKTDYAVLTGHTDADLIGVSAVQDRSFDLTFVRGSGAAFDRGQVLVGVALARSEGLTVGSPLRLDTPSGFRTVTVGGVWLNGNFNGRVVDMPVALFRRLYGDVEPPDTIRVTPAPGIGLDTLKARLVAARLDPDLVVQTPAQVVQRASNDVGHQLDTFNALQRGLLVVAFIAVLSTLLLVGVQRRREVGLLAAIGMEPGQLGRMVLVEALGVGLLASVTAIAGGVLMNLAFNYNIPLIVGYKDPLRFAFWSLLLWIPVTIALVLAAAALPAWRTSRLEVLEAVQYE